MVPLGYTPNTTIKTSKNSFKYDLTFSVSYYSEREDIIGNAGNAEFTELIQKRLVASECFSSVRYASVGEMSPYHVHFNFRVSGPTVPESMGVGYLAGMTLMVIPTWETFAIDSSAKVFVDRKKVHSVATTELERVFIWLPLAPVGTVWNSWAAWGHEEKKAVDFLIKDINTFQESDTFIEITKRS